MEETEYQALFNAKGTAEKNYKIRERTSDFFGVRRRLELPTLVLVLSPSARTSERVVQTTTKPGRQARVATGG